MLLLWVASCHVPFGQSRPQWWTYAMLKEIHRLGHCICTFVCYVEDDMAWYLIDVCL